MNRNLVSLADVRGWLKNEEENIRPYLKAWKGANPYDSLSRKNFNFWAMLIVVAATVIWSIFGSTAFDGIEYILPIGFFGLVFHGWKSSREELEKFFGAVRWCEFEAIPEHILFRSRWSKENINDALDGFVRIIRTDILPLEKEYKENGMLPKRSAEARKLHDSRKAKIVKDLKMIGPMFNHFEGITNPLEEVFRLANEKP